VKFYILKPNSCIVDAFYFRTPAQIGRVGREELPKTGSSALSGVEGSQLALS
jgi:hypothetical protein